MPTAVEVLISENVNPVRRTSHLARKTIKRGQRSDMIDCDGMLCVIDGMATRIADEQNYIGGDFPRDFARDSNGNRVHDFAKASSWISHGAYLDVALLYGLGRKEPGRLIRRLKWASGYKGPFFDYDLPHAEVIGILHRARETVIEERDRR